MSLDQCLAESYTSTLWKTLFKTTTSLLLTDHVNRRGMSLDQCLAESYTSTLWKTLFKTTTSLLLTDHVNSRGGLALPNVKGVS